MSLNWQISVGQLSEALRTAAFLLAALVSTWTLADARRRSLSTSAIALWTAGTLAFPVIAFPLYLCARLLRPHKKLLLPFHEIPPADSSEILIFPEASGQANRGDEGTNAGGASREIGQITFAAADETMAPAGDGASQTLPFFWRRAALPLAYLLMLLASATFFFYRDYHSRDARLARASTANLHGQHARAVREYRAALRLRDDPHTRKLLGLALASEGQRAPALAELRVAEQAGAPDEALPYHLAVTLDALGHTDEAAAAYRRFLQSELCDQPLPHPRCVDARLRAITLVSP